MDGDYYVNKQGANAIVSSPNWRDEDNGKAYSTRRAWQYPAKIVNPPTIGGIKHEADAPETIKPALVNWC